MATASGQSAEHAAAPRRAPGRLPAPRRTEAPLVAILHSAVAADAPPDEQDTLEQVRAVAGALRGLGLRVAALPLTRDLALASSRLKRLRPACVFNLVESVDGRGDAIHLAPTLLASLDLPFTGCDTRSMLFTADKRSAKRLLAGAGIATPPLFEPGTRGHGPWIVKSVWEDASIGIDAGSIVDGARCAAEITSRTARFGGEWFAEGFVDGREFNIAVLETASGPRVLPIAEMCFVDFPADMPRIVDYAAKWDESSFAYRNTRRSFDLAAADSALLGHLQAVALRCWEVFGLAGYARVDVRVDTLGLPWVLELNANPCLAPDAGFAAAATRAGMSYATLVGAVLESAAPGLLASTRGNRLDAA